MRYTTFSVSGDSTERLGVVVADRVIDVGEAIGNSWPGGSCPKTLLELIQAGPEAWRRMASLFGGNGSASAIASPGFRLQDVNCHAPITRPTKNVFCVGRNYASHIKEASQALKRELKIPEVPVFFTKVPTSVTGPYDAIPWDPSVTQELDYEAELGVIIGVQSKNLERTHALARVFGYTIINDLSARDLQKSHTQWFKGKSLDGFCPIGPWVVTSDEFGDPQNKRIALRVNGVVKQDATTGDMIFPVAVILESLSRGLTLEAGDIIATGTPEGVGLGRTPPEYLNDGDLVETEIEGIGVMRNRVVARTG
ncbi:MAG: 5-carboxymethyl-2-hydroxymuconate isomerase [Blastocatellia bacterium]|nr:MAG: 5-carboxymethyl-2-hydroxymuconate isomerase [Blastocatellia bacterium]